MKKLNSTLQTCCCNVFQSGRTFNSAILIALLLFSASTFGQTTIVNYDFNAGTSYGTLNGNAAAGITAFADGSSAFATGTGMATGSNEFTENATAGNALSTGKNSSWTFTLTGASLSCYSSFKVYFQGKSSSGTNNFNLTYSLNGNPTFINTDITPSASLSVSSSAFSEPATVFSLPASVNNPTTSLAIRISIPNTTGSPTYLLDNVQIQGIVNCNDNNACTDDACNAASGCVFTPITCNDNNACTDDVCNPASGCVFTNNTTSCNDNNACTESDACSGGSCEGTAINCDDNDACTMDDCNTSTGCVNSSVDCDDDDACTDDSCDSESGCQYAEHNCNDDDACTDDSCDEILGCQYATHDCNDGNACTDDDCDAESGCQYAAHICDDASECTLDFCDPLTGCFFPSFPGTTCIVPDNGNGTADLPPSCTGGYRGEMQIVDGLPPTAPIEIQSMLTGPTIISRNPGGSLGGDRIIATEMIAMQLTGIAPITLNKTVNFQLQIEIHTAPYVPGNPVQNFNTEMQMLQGQLPHGDPDFDLLRITAGSGFGMPSPGHTTLTKMPGGWAVESFFDITYRIDFVGKPGGALSGMSGSTTATIRMSTGTTSVPCTDDGNLCTRDVCVDGQCLHLPVNCDDNNACTDDFCNPSIGCHYLPHDCNDNDACSDDSCNPSSGCQHSTISCFDNNPCTDDFCDAEIGCHYLPHECNDGNACTDDYCDENIGCYYLTHECDDSDACTDNACDETLGCQYTTRDCNDSDACTDDFCDSETGCYHILHECGDNNECTDDYCDSEDGCFYLEHICDDNNECTNDLCDSELGCYYETVDCNDHDACTIDDCNINTGCDYEAVDCDDHDACTTETCIPESGCHYLEIFCFDGNACTIDRCNSETGCHFDTVNCNDSDACTDDDCDESSGCQYTEHDCNDNDACTDDFCNSETGCYHISHECGDNNECTDDNCDSDEGCYYLDRNCHDDNLCTRDLCDVELGCYYEAVDCNDGDACTDDFCNEIIGCHHSAHNCDDNNACTTDLCNSDSGCYYEAVDCDDHDACTDDFCNSETGCYHILHECGDNNECTDDFCDSAIGCHYLPHDCNDSKDCTDDDCDETLGCIYTSVDCDDDDACTTDDCNDDGGCFHRAVDCNDNNACTIDRCDSDSGCYYDAVNCDDSNECTDDDCNEISGCFYTAHDCNDDNACTTDLCDSDTGCYYEAVDCDDSDACTDDACDEILGCQYSADDCDDNNACTDNLCDSGTGCYYKAVDCDDFDACTTDDCDETSGCQHAAVICDDSNDCTDDACDSHAGCIYLPVNCDDGDACTSDDCVNGGCVHTYPEIPAEDLAQPASPNPCLVYAGRIVIKNFVYDAGLSTLPVDFDGGPGSEEIMISQTIVRDHVTCLDYIIVHVFVRKDCDDNNPCTTDECVNGECIHTSPQIPAEDLAQPASPDPCLVYAGRIVIKDFVFDENLSTLPPLFEGGPDAVEIMISQTIVKDHVTCLDYIIVHVFVPKNCDDNNPCTTDKCVNGDCIHISKDCSDNNLCTIDGCDVANGNCTNTPKDCNDGNACTVDACNPADGSCANTPKDCNDNNSCTNDVCVSGICQNLNICNPCTLEVLSLTLVNSSTELDIRTLNGTDTINLAVTPNVNVRANLCVDPIGSVKFQLNGSTVKVESTSPYALAGDNNGNYNKWNVSTGLYTLTAIPYSGANGTGTQGVSKTITLRVINQSVGGCAGNAECNDNNPCTSDVCQNSLCINSSIANCCISSANCDDGNICTTDACINNACSNTLAQRVITSLTLVNSASDLDIGPLADGEIINLAVTPNINVRANLCTNTGTGSVRFKLNNSVFKIEGSAPFALAGDNNGNYNKWNVTPGVYTIEAVPFQGSNATGTAGTGKLVTITVINSASKMEQGDNNSSENSELSFSAYPNPFNHHLSVSFSVPSSEKVRVEIISMEGKLMTVLFDGIASKHETYNLKQSTSSWASGMYFYRLTAESGIILNKKILLYR